MFRFVLCDDSRAFLELLERSLQQLCPKLLVAGEDCTVGPLFTEGTALLQFLSETMVDALFLDIDMPEMDGFSLAQIICREYKETKIIFVSSHDNFVYSAFEYYPFAFLRKERMAKELPGLLHRLLDTLRVPNQTVALSTVDGTKSVRATELTYVETNKNYCLVHTVHQKVYTCRYTISELEQLLCGRDFFRVHTSFLVNLRHVEGMPKDASLQVHGKKIPIAQRRVSDFKKQYMEYTRRRFGI